jgi:hypothetical protein
LFSVTASISDRNSGKTLKRKSMNSGNFWQISRKLAGAGLDSPDMPELPELPDGKHYASGF